MSLVPGKLPAAGASRLVGERTSMCPHNTTCFHVLVCALQLCLQVCQLLVLLLLVLKQLHKSALQHMHALLQRQGGVADSLHAADKHTGRCGP